jgi:phage gp16-like protein
MSKDNASVGENRNAMMGKIHIAKKRLNMDDESYQDLIANQTGGKRSCRDCDRLELARVLEALYGLGFVGTPKTKLSPPTGAVATQGDKIRAMWIDLHRRGIVRQAGDDAIQKFVKRLTKVDRVEWLEHAQAVAVITALTKMGKIEDNPPDPEIA